MFCSPAWNSSASVQLACREGEEPAGRSSASITTSSHVSLILPVFFSNVTELWPVSTSHTWLNRNALRTNRGNWAFSATQTGWWCVRTGCRSQFASLGGWEVRGREVEVGRGSNHSIIKLPSFFFSSFRFSKAIFFCRGNWLFFSVALSGSEQ